MKSLFHKSDLPIVTVKRSVRIVDGLRICDEVVCFTGSPSPQSSPIKGEEAVAPRLRNRLSDFALKNGCRRLGPEKCVPFCSIMFRFVAGHRGIMALIRNTFGT